MESSLLPGYHLRDIPTDGILEGRQDEQLTNGQRALAADAGAQAERVDRGFSYRDEFVRLFGIHKWLLKRALPQRAPRSTKRAQRTASATDAEETAYDVARRAGLIGCIQGEPRS